MVVLINFLRLSSYSQVEGSNLFFGRDVSYRIAGPIYYQNYLLMLGVYNIVRNSYL